MLKEIKTAIEDDNLMGAGMSMSLGFPNWNSLIQSMYQPFLSKW